MSTCYVILLTSACRLRCDISNAGNIFAAVAAASPNLTRLELSCCDAFATSMCDASVRDALCRDLLQLPSSGLLSARVESNVWLQTHQYMYGTAQSVSCQQILQPLALSTTTAGSAAPHEDRHGKVCNFNTTWRLFTPFLTFALSVTQY
jgi:hypothetical protein